MSEPRWIRFTQMSGLGPGRYWRVVAKDGNLELGVVDWYAPWRKYCFTPRQECDLLFEERCLRDIADFVEARTRERKENTK